MLPFLRVACGGEHRVQIPAHGAGQGKVAAPEKQLNCFVHFVALIERVGNALGTLAFTWATVVLLGGYPAVVLPYDFWSASSIVFLEAARMFSRNNRLDYQLFFRTKGAFRSLGWKWNGLIVIVCLSDAWVCMILRRPIGVLLFFAILLAVGQAMFPGLVRLLICKPLRRAISLWSPVIAILLMAPSVPDHYYDRKMDKFIFKNSISMSKLIAYLVLLVVVLLLTISRLRFPSIIKLVDSALGSKQVFWRRVILNLCMSAAILMLFMLNRHIDFWMISIEVYALALVSFGNLQIPAAAVRVALALVGLTSQNYGVNGHDEQNDPKRILTQSLNIFYGMVFGQGILYIVACMFEVLSFIPRRSLVRRGGFRCQWGVESVNLYYTYAFEKCTEGGMLAPKKISLIAFAMDYLNSDSSKNQLYGIRMLHIFLQRESTKAQLLSKLAASTKTMTRLIRMLDWTSQEDKEIRLFAAKVTVELAKNLRVATIPGTMQLVSALLDADDEQVETQDQTLNAADNQEETHDPIPNTDNLPETPTRSTQQVGTAAQNSCVLRCWQRISEFWSIPKEEPLTDHDLLPAMGMSIIGSLAGCDQDNCVEISKATDLIPKIVGFTGYKIYTTNTEAQQKVLVKSSLEVLQRLTKIDGEIGITLRYKISEDPFLLNNLAEILEDSSSSQELRELTIDIITKLAMDEGIRQEIGSIQVILTKLMYAFLARDGPSNAHSDCSMPIKAGQALAMLTLESVDNCSAVLKEPGVEFIKDLARMLNEDRYRYMAASLLRNLCTHSRAELSDSDLGELSHALPEVLERVMDAERKELEVLVGISSQICSLIPESFMQALEQGPNEARFMEKLVNALNVNMKPSAQCPGIRRVVIEQSISMMELNSRYANQFRDIGLMNALSRVEKTPSRAEKYRLFLGNAGLMEHSTHLSSLVVRAKQLMTMH